MKIESELKNTFLNIGDFQIGMEYDKEENPLISLHNDHTRYLIDMGKYTDRFMFDLQEYFEKRLCNNNIIIGENPNDIKIIICHGSFVDTYHNKNTEIEPDIMVPLEAVTIDEFFPFEIISIEAV